MQRFAPLATHVPALAVHAGTGGILALIAEIQQGGHIVVDTQDDTAAVTAVAAIGTAGGYIFFPVEGHGAVAAATADDRDSYLIYKHKRILLASEWKIDSGKLKRFFSTFDCQFKLKNRAVANVSLQQPLLHYTRITAPQCRRSTDGDPCPCART